VQGVVEIRARAVDEVTPPARLRIVSPEWLVDSDGDATNAVVTASFDASARPEDQIEVVVEARDSSAPPQPFRSTVWPTTPTTAAPGEIAPPSSPDVLRHDQVGRTQTGID
jgi:hypothetical protein